MQVAVALIYDEKQRVLTTQRPLHVPHGGYWEFPGGKVQANESAEAALIREIKEEVDLDVLDYCLLTRIDYQYPDKTVQLIVFQVTEYQGNPVCREGQLAMRWSKPDELNPALFPEANRSIFNLFLPNVLTIQENT